MTNDLLKIIILKLMICLTEFDLKSESSFQPCVVSQGKLVTFISNEREITFFIFRLQKQKSIFRCQFEGH